MSLKVQQISLNENFAALPCHAVCRSSAKGVRALDQDYTNDENNIREAQNIALRVVDMNYPNRNRDSPPDGARA
jgi:hypothetical protein